MIAGREENPFKTSKLGCLVFEKPVAVSLIPFGTYIK